MYIFNLEIKREYKEVAKITGELSRGVSLVAFSDIVVVKEWGKHFSRGFLNSWYAGILPAHCV